jgi:hypothetical protein
MRTPAVPGQAVNQAASSAVTSSLRLARKAVVAVLGLSVLGFGVALIVLPGPSILVIPLGLALLATEFLWARRLLRPVRKLLRRPQACGQWLLGRPPRPTIPKSNAEAGSSHERSKRDQRESH